MNYKSRLWVVEVNGEEVPIVSAVYDLAECVTKTMSQVESDDESRPRPRVSVSGLPGGLSGPVSRIALELATKTEGKGERDDR